MRLNTIYSLIPPCKSLADIGCDHAIVSLHAAKSGIEKVYAVDISQTAVDKAKRRLYHYKNATALLSDGFDAIPQRVEVAVITGMGGMKIIEILQKANYKPTLVLGAQHDSYKLRQYLNGSGYIIEKDFCLIDRNKYYDFILAKQGESESLDEIQLTYGKFYKEKNEFLKVRVEKEIANLITYSTCESEERLKMAKEVEKWQR